MVAVEYQSNLEWCPHEETVHHGKRIFMHINSGLKMLTQIYSPNTRVVEAGRWEIQGTALVIQCVWGQLGLCESLSLKETKPKIKPGCWAVRSMLPLPRALSLTAKISTHSLFLVFVILVWGIQFRISQMMCKAQPLTHAPAHSSILR